MRAEVVSVPNNTPTLVATGERGYVRLSLSQGQVIGGQELLASQNPMSSGYAIATTKEYDFYLEKGEEVYVCYNLSYQPTASVSVLYYSTQK
jgi:hypothetical protein